MLVPGAIILNVSHLFSLTLPPHGRLLPKMLTFFVSYYSGDNYDSVRTLTKNVVFQSNMLGEKRLRHFGHDSYQAA
jgi:hypothetical protein